MLRDQEGIPSTCIREISILKDLSHANVVRLYDVVLRRKYLFGAFFQYYCFMLLEGLEIFLVFEYVDMDLSGLLKKYQNRQLPTELTRVYFYST